MSLEIRKHYFLDKYVIFTPQRKKRPRKTGRISKIKILKEFDCPFCFDKVEKKLLIKTYPSFQRGKPQYFVLKNKYPIVTIDSPKTYGWHELVSETPSHFKELSELNYSEIKGLFEVYKDRLRTLSKIKNINYISVFKNHGFQAGATRFHAHSQIIAFKLLPPTIQEEKKIIQKFLKTKIFCLYCDILKKEENGPRKIFANKEIVAFCPYASQYHYEVWILPRRHVSNLTDLTEKEIISLVKVLKKSLVKFLISLFLIIFHFPIFLKLKRIGIFI